MLDRDVDIEVVCLGVFLGRVIEKLRKTSFRRDKAAAVVNFRLHVVVERLARSPAEAVGVRSLGNQEIELALGIGRVVKRKAVARQVRVGLVLVGVELVEVDRFDGVGVLRDGGQRQRQEKQGGEGAGHAR